MKDKEAFGFAGLWEEWLDKETGELIESCTIITTGANEVLETVHDRMPVILKPDNYSDWLSESTGTDKLHKLLRPYPADEMETYAVSREVNKPSNDSPELINRQ